MAFIFADSFEGYTNANDWDERGWQDTGQAPEIETTTVKDGLVAMKIKQQGFLAYTVGNNDGPDQSFLSVWFRYDHNTTAVSHVIDFYDDGTRTWSLRLNTDDTLQWYNATQTATGPKSTAIQKDRWYHLEIKFRVNASITSGDVEVKVDGITECTLAAATDTTWFGTTVDGFALFGANEGTTEYNYFDSPIWWGGNTVAGDPFDDYLGRLRIGSIHPNANGNTSGLTGSDGNSVDNYLLVDEKGIYDGDTTYVESDTVNTKDTWNYENMTGDIVSIHLVQSVTIAKKTGVGDRQIQAVTRTGATPADYNGSSHVLVQDTYNTYLNQWFTNPDTAADWTESEINAAEFGVEVTT